MDNIKRILIATLSCFTILTNTFIPVMAEEPSSPTPTSTATPNATDIQQNNDDNLSETPDVAAEPNMSSSDPKENSERTTGELLGYK